eukprot:CAMPEP_0197538118 /NCGR_PEP_ID=MMETSP1318-20131121/58863_1 /TAXON_ID=552666 /ORGANISM="Partenskyella glossopodia, Strain RCC365" /LENGTH=161 /DNA_ID=CAMNT_0043096451 /DNA_START=25 /DNA_END=513 /DNA_ORIENTATION=+
MTEQTDPKPSKKSRKSKKRRAKVVPALAMPVDLPPEDKMLVPPGDIVFVHRSDIHVHADAATVTVGSNSQPQSQPQAQSKSKSQAQAQPQSQLESQSQSEAAGSMSSDGSLFRVVGVVDSAFFDSIVLSPTMVEDHLLRNYLDAMESVVMLGGGDNDLGCI